MAEQSRFPPFLSFLLLICILQVWCCRLVSGKEVIVPVGVVLDLNATVGTNAVNYITMAVSDFYAAHPNYLTRLDLITRDSSGNDVVTAAAAALDLIANKEVKAIIGPEWSSQAKFVIEIGNKAHVPIVSYSATSPSLSPTLSKYFIRAAQNDSSQVKAITNIVQAYGWWEIVLIYEDTEYGNGLVPYLLDAFQEIGTRVTNRSGISPSFSEREITGELQKLKATNKKVFLVHMTALVGSKFFSVAKKTGMMEEDYAWIVTQGLSTLVDPVGAEVMDSMQGVLGVRPYIPKSKKLETFKSRWRKNITSNTSSQDKIRELNLFGLWAYDTVWAIAMAAEKARVLQYPSRFMKQNASHLHVDLAALGISQGGSKFRDSILSARFEGLSGTFSLTKGELEALAFEVFNVIGRMERIIGYWTPARGLSKSLDPNIGQAEFSASANNLKQPIWPGYTTNQPRKLRIGVPKRTGFYQFVNVEWDLKTDELHVSGFSPDVFRAVLKALPFELSYDFIPFVNENGESNGTYNDLLRQIKDQKFDAVVGDTTIVADRSLYVDFTLPYSESGVSMVVLTKRDERENMWLFLKPLSWKLWLTSAAAFVFTGLVVWVLEHRINTEFRGPPDQQLATMFWFSFSTLVFAHREKVVNNWTKFVLIIWVFVVLIISQSYTASFTSMLTVQRLQPTFADAKQIKDQGYSVGYQTNSFVKDFLITQLGFNETQLKNYSTPEDYDVALSKGNDGGGVAAIFDEIPYIKIFLAKDCKKFQMVGPTYKTDGFGFAFPLGSPLVSYMSRAILNVTEDKAKMEKIDGANFGEDTNCEDQGTQWSSGSSLPLSSFGGLFIITFAASIFSLLIYIVKFLCLHWSALNNTEPEGSFCLKILELARHFDKKDISAHHVKRSESRVHPQTSPDASEAPHNGDNAQHDSTISNEGPEDPNNHTTGNRTTSTEAEHPVTE